MWGEKTFVASHEQDSKKIEIKKHFLWEREWKRGGRKACSCHSIGNKLNHSFLFVCPRCRSAVLKFQSHSSKIPILISAKHLDGRKSSMNAGKLWGRSRAFISWLKTAKSIRWREVSVSAPQSLQGSTSSCRRMLHSKCNWVLIIFRAIKLCVPLKTRNHSTGSFRFKDFLQ